jgi:hypothetical protein
MVLNLADPCRFGMVVKDFGGEKVDFTGEQHTHNQGVNPVLVPIISPVSQRCRLALSLVWTQSACLALRNIHNTK